MNLYPNSFDENKTYITPTEIVEFTYCKRRTYYAKVLGIAEHEELRYLVQKGKEKHKIIAEKDKKYLSKKLGVLFKESEVILDSEKLHMRGVVDEVLHLKDGGISPLDYKFSDYQEEPSDIYVNQLVLYSLLLEDIYKTTVNFGYLVYCRDYPKLQEVEITHKLKKSVYKILDDYYKVLLGYYPQATRTKSKCVDCTYRNLCVKNFT